MNLARPAGAFTLASVLAALLTIPAAASLPAARYNSVLRLVRALSTSPNVRLLAPGRTYSGMSIPACVITDFSVESSAKARVMICSGQHGDEFGAVRSVLALGCNLASGSDPKLLKRCVIILVPMVNPSGISAATRANNEGLDLNRDWTALGSAETRYVDGLIRDWRPNLLIDAHEWTEPIATNGNQIEAPHCLTPEHRRAVDVLAHKASVDCGLQVIECSALADKRLFHRNYGCMGYAAYLLETSATDSYTKKKWLYASAILTLARSAAGDSSLRAALSPAAAKFSFASVQAYLQPKAPADPQAFARMFQGIMLLALGYALCLWAAKPFSRQRHMQWSRRFVRCEVDESVPTHPLLARRLLTPITSRSWVNRRLRARYAVPKADLPEPRPEPAATFITPRYSRTTPATSDSRLPR